MMSSSIRKRVLIVDVLQGFSEIQELTTLSCDIAFTHHSNPPPQALLDAFPTAKSFSVDLKTGVGFEDISHQFGRLDVVVNCTALSIPRACEMDPDAAVSVNVPSSLVNWISSFEESNCLLIHLSTDQVYEGVKSFYKEEDEAVPVNVHGKSKLAAEQFIAGKCSNYAILRSSIIYGPQTISPVSKSLPIQWVDGVLSKGTTADFFHDEFRCPVYVKDVVGVILALSKTWISEAKQRKLVLNVGGPDRVSRVQMAETVAEIRGYNLSLIKFVSASSVDRGVRSPADISMDITKLVQTLGISPVLFRDGVIEHMVEHQAHLFGDLALTYFRPKILIISTPNYDLDERSESQPCNKFRNHEHTFEWTRAQFNCWATELAARHNYGVEFSGVGGSADEPGSASQIFVFKRRTIPQEDNNPREVSESEHRYQVIWEWTSSDRSKICFAKNADSEHRN